VALNDDLPDLFAVSAKVNSTVVDFKISFLAPGTINPDLLPLLGGDSFNFFKNIFPSATDGNKMNLFLIQFGQVFIVGELAVKDQIL